MAQMGEGYLTTAVQYKVELRVYLGIALHSELKTTIKTVKGSLMLCCYTCSSYDETQGHDPLVFSQLKGVTKKGYI